MAEPQSIMNISQYHDLIAKILSFLVAIVLMILGYFLRRLQKDFDGKITREEYEEHNRLMSFSVETVKKDVENVKKDIEKSSNLIGTFDQRLDDMKTILMAVAIKMEITDPKQIIEKYLLNKQ